jgi:hypothetical protein
VTDPNRDLSDVLVGQSEYGLVFFSNTWLICVLFVAEIFANLRLFVKYFISAE